MFYEIGAIIIGISSFVIIWWVSKLYYELFISPLKEVPGPLVLQLFPMYRHILSMLGMWPNIEAQYCLEYGPAVRTGWESVTFSSEEAMKEIYSTHIYKKGSIYSMLRTGSKSQITIAEKEFHKKRKRALSNAFSMKALSSIEKPITEHAVGNLIRVLNSKSGTENQSPANLYQLFGQQSLDFLGEIVFGQSFGHLERGYHPLMEWIFMSNVHSFIQDTFPFLKYTPDPVRKLKQFSTDAVKRARESGKDSIFLQMINNAELANTRKMTDGDVADETMLEILAGGNRISTAITWFFYQIIKHPKSYQRLFEELKEKFPERNQLIDMDSCKLGQLNYMDAAIKESLRMMPEVGVTLPRCTPSNGRTIHGYYIPEMMEVKVNLFALHNRPDLWGHDVKNFNPDRWLTNKNYPKEDFTYFNPFSIGPQACFGRHLTMSIMQLTVANLARKFEFKLVDDNLVLNPYAAAFTRSNVGKLMVNVEKRAS